MKIPPVQELTVLPPDDPDKKTTGWLIKETIGIGIINEYPFLPLYKKIFRKKFWNNIFYKLIKRKVNKVQYINRTHIG